MTLYDFAKAVLRPTTKTLFAATVEGTENVPPSGPLIVAANHRSYLDPPLLGTWFPRTVHFMAKEELFRIPVLGPLITRVNAFPVTRGKGDVRSIRRALRVLKEGGVVGMFPEGTRNLTGDVEAKGGAVLLSTLAHCPVIPVGLSRTNIATRRLRGAHVEMRIGKPMTFQGSSRKPTKAELDVWTNELSAAIAALTD
jgi:1-acyl-sn-glycerol-3-phosphate acyltransferase